MEINNELNELDFAIWMKEMKFCKWGEWDESG